ncbi:kinesin-like protein KIN-12F [Magnolia sinica]|uniref:kinesin-like protein KIN-12F n=1 Tax=Magnolia sinica TaxID=86752 RepID=UPI00265A489E|nr:kinesin-like protein KIN-12F [Magnolia sinica]
MSLLLPRSISDHLKMNPLRRKSKRGRENTAPPDPNVLCDRPVSPSVPKKLTAPAANSQKVGSGSDSQDHRSAALEDSSVKIVARIRPVSGLERGSDRIVRKLSSNSLSVEDRIFSFDSVVDSDSTQEDVFQLVGIPLVKNSLAGFNTSILSYGQTGSGKTHTMWGPPSAMVEGNYSPRSNQGIVPRIFHMLFSEIQKEKENSDEGQINYQCRCSFLEIYKEQITDLLDPTQRNLQIRDDAKNGFYVENLSEEYVTSFEDVTQILIKGLSNRKVGATSINSKSSRSHIIFTCVIESWCKGTLSKCFSSSKSSRISLVDLAGSERNKLDDAGRECVKDARNVKWSLSQLGYLVNTLAEVGQSGKPQNIPYKNSCLTHLLRESLGGNAKLTVICAISPDDRCKGETLSTLRFGQRAKSIQNKAVINEITEDYVNDLSDQIRQLKEELTRVKSNGDDGSVGNNGGYFKRHNARESLNQLRLSLNRSLILPHIESDSEEEINIDEEDVRELCVQLHNVHDPSEDNLRDMPENNMSMQFSSFEENSDMDTANGLDSLENGFELSATIPPEGKSNNILLREPEKECRSGSLENLHASQDILGAIKEDQSQDSSSTSASMVRASLTIIPSRQSPVLLDPTLSDSPKIDNKQKKTVSFVSSNLSESQHNPSESPKLNSDVLRQSVKRSDNIRSSLQSSKAFSNPTESLAASLHRGLQIIDYHQQYSASKNSFSFENLILKQSHAAERVDASMQTPAEYGQPLGESSNSFLCALCKRGDSNGSKQVRDSLNTCIVPFDEVGTTDRLRNQVAKDEENDLAAAIKRQQELEKVCAEQVAKIEQLNHLVEQCKLEHQHDSVIKQSQDTKILCLEGLTEENMLLADERKILKLGYENHPEVSSTDGEPKELQKELDHEYKVSFEMGEKEALLKEIQSLKDQLQSHINASSNGSVQKQSSTALSQSIQLRSSAVGSISLDEVGKELEKERQKWTEMESGWISLTEELRVDLESNRRLAEKTEIELRHEKKCSDELDDALQRAMLGHARMIEHYAELQEKYNGLLEKHRKIMEGIAEVKRVAAKAGGKGAGKRFVESLAAELSALRVERDRERDRLKKENKSLKVQLRDTAEAVHAAGELLVRLKEAEEAVSATEEKFVQAQQESEKVKKQMEKLKKKHKMEIITMKQYLAESRLPESALRPVLQQDLDRPDDQDDWRAEFSPLYRQDSYNNSMGYNNSNVRSYVDLYRDK